MQSHLRWHAAHNLFSVLPETEPEIYSALPQPEGIDSLFRLEQLTSVSSFFWDELSLITGSTLNHIHCISNMPWLSFLLDKKIRQKENILSPGHESTAVSRWPWADLIRQFPQHEWPNSSWSNRRTNHYTPLITEAATAFSSVRSLLQWTDSGGGVKAGWCAGIRVSQCWEKRAASFLAFARGLSLHIGLPRYLLPGKTGTICKVKRIGKSRHYLFYPQHLPCGVHWAFSETKRWLITSIQCLYTDCPGQEPRADGTLATALLWGVAWGCAGRWEPTSAALGRGGSSSAMPSRASISDPEQSRAHGAVPHAAATDSYAAAKPYEKEK